jgi:hypothetical protein
LGKITSGLYGPRFEAKFSAPATTKPHRAKQLFGEWLAEVEGKIAAIRADRDGTGRSLTPTETRKLAGDWYEWYVARLAKELREELKGAIDAKNADELFAIMIAKLEAELGRVQASLDKTLLQKVVASEFERLSKAESADDQVWRVDLPGRVIFNKVASAANIQSGRLKQLYLAHVDPQTTFREIITIFEEFRNA